MRAFYGVDFDPKTNADRIRGMDDEELAEFLSHIEAYRTYGYYAAHGLDWLRQPAEEIHDGN
ncbi:hypothetical protein [Oscillibacter sp.]|uniref:hypothetical protein n=1 Tax=Oscillibacter sp. TaxID=1945593 RepID=UPI002898D620|nr:hypothetical protein [Oscillibacter sp.]